MGCQQRVLARTSLGWQQGGVFYVLGFSQIYAPFIEGFDVGALSLRLPFLGLVWALIWAIFVMFFDCILSATANVNPIEAVAMTLNRDTFQVK